MRTISVCIPETSLAGLEKLVKLKRFPHRSEAIRVAIRDFLKREFYGENYPAPVEEKSFEESTPLSA